MIFVCFVLSCGLLFGLVDRRPSGLRRVAAVNPPAPSFGRAGAVPSGRAAASGSAMALGRAGGRGEKDGRPTLDLEATAGLADRLAALLGAGLPVSDCWATLARGVGVGGRPPRGPAGAWGVPAVASTVERVVGAGGSVGDGLRVWAAPRRTRFRHRSDEGVLWLAALWDLMDGCGAAPARVLRAVAEALRAERDLRAAAEVAAAGPRATVLILMGMPLAAIGLGSSLGAGPIAVLLFTPAGRICLILGCASWLAGIVWARRLIRAGR